MVCMVCMVCDMSDRCCAEIECCIADQWCWLPKCNALLTLRLAVWLQHCVFWYARINKHSWKHHTVSWAYSKGPLEIIACAPTWVTETTVFVRWWPSRTRYSRPSSGLLHSWADTPCGRRSYASLPYSSYDRKPCSDRSPCRAKMVDHTIKVIHVVPAARFQVVQVVQRELHVGLQPEEDYD